jgi:Na+/H+-dicarboxylate symporter
VLWKAALYAVISGAVFALLGTLSAWFIGFGRIPVIPGTAPETEIVGLVDLIRNTITRNGFRTLVGESSFLLPIMIPAFLLGWHFHHDREISEPAYNFFDSLSRLIYRANRYLLILMPGFLAVFHHRGGPGDTKNRRLPTISALVGDSAGNHFCSGHRCLSAASVARQEAENRLGGR